MALRVISGSAGGRRLVAPKSAARPTADRVKEALFNALGAEAVAGAHVADLYAGSGALGIEALSRGAARAVFVDDDHVAVRAMRTNLDAVGFSDRARVQRSTVGAFVGRVAPEAPFDLVFLDPPYELPDADLGKVIDGLAGPGWLLPGAVVVMERARGDAPRHLPDGWRTRFERTYGDTLVVVATV